MGKMGYLMKDFQTTWQIHRKKSRFIHNPYITQNKFQIYQRFKNEITLLLLSHIHLFAIPWTVACQSPLFMGFSRQEYWSGLPSPSPGDLPYPGIEPTFPVSPALSAYSLPLAPPGKPKYNTKAAKYNKSSPYNTSR